MAAARLSVFVVTLFLLLSTLSAVPLRASLDVEIIPIEDLSSSNSSGIHPPVGDDGDIVYITFHGGDSGVNTVMAYKTSTGEELGAVLTNGAATGLRELRGMAFSPEGHLLVANAWKLDSRIVEFGPCNNGGGREFVKTLVSPTDIMQHPYGLIVAPAASQTTQGNVSGMRTNDSASNGDLQLFVASQDGTIAVSYFDVETGAPLPAQSKSSSSEAGGWLAMDSSGDTRGIAVYNGYLFLARQGKNDVHVYHMADQQEVAKISVSAPIGLEIDETNGILFVGSNDANDAGIHTFSLASISHASPALRANDTDFAELGSISLGTEYSHPAGIVLSSSGKTLYITVQNNPALLQVPVSALINGKASPSSDLALVTLLTTEPESIILSPCFR